MTMSSTHFHPFESTLQTAEDWIRDTEQNLGTDNPDAAYRALRGVLHAVRDRIDTHEAIHFGAQMPHLIRGVYYDGWRPENQTKERRMEQFLDRVRVAMNAPDPEPMDACLAVFKTVKTHMDQGELQQVRDMLHDEIKPLWDDA